MAPCSRCAEASTFLLFASSQPSSAAASHRYIPIILPIGASHLAHGRRPSPAALTKLPTTPVHFSCHCLSASSLRSDRPPRARSGWPCCESQVPRSAPSPPGAPRALCRCAAVRSSPRLRLQQRLLPWRRSICALRRFQLEAARFQSQSSVVPRCVQFTPHLAPLQQSPFSRALGPSAAQCRFCRLPPSAPCGPGCLPHLLGVHLLRFSACCLHSGLRSAAETCAAARLPGGAWGCQPGGVELHAPGWHHRDRRTRPHHQRCAGRLRPLRCAHPRPPGLAPAPAPWPCFRPCFQL